LSLNSWIHSFFWGWWWWLYFQHNS
jgi:hypothetical protein